MSDKISDRQKKLEGLLGKKTAQDSDPQEEEKKTKRVNGLFTPSVYNDIQLLARIDDTSFNNLLHEIAKEYADSRREELNKERKRIAEINRLINEMDNK